MVWATTVDAIVTDDRHEVPREGRIGKPVKLRHRPAAVTVTIGSHGSPKTGLAPPS